MSKKRPTSLTVFAILNLVFGGLGMFCNLCGVAGLVATPALEKMQKDQGAKGGFDTLELQKHMEARIPGYAILQWSQVGIGVILSLILILGGIGLLRMQPSARWLCVGYSIISIIYHLSYMIYTIIIVNPEIDEWLTKQGVQLPSGLFTAGSVAGAIIGMTYAVVLLIFMMIPSTGKALAANNADEFGRGTDDYYDPDFERRRRDVPPEES